MFSPSPLLLWPAGVNRTFDVSAAFSNVALGYLWPAYVEAAREAFGDDWWEATLLALSGSVMELSASREWTGEAMTEFAQAFAAMSVLAQAVLLRGPR